ncbi:hypothetical protein GCM10010195_05900 [Kitasatospora griseola]|nr:hypothetical protein GCM10010195_05900 [Kitasatospora griseola]
MVRGADPVALGVVHGVVHQGTHLLFGDHGFTPPSHSSVRAKARPARVRTFRRGVERRRSPGAATVRDAPGGPGRPIFVDGDAGRASGRPGRAAAASSGRAFGRVGTD